MLYYKMNTQTIFMCVVALLIGMLVANTLQNFCGCKKVEGFVGINPDTGGPDTGMALSNDPRMPVINQFIQDNQSSKEEAPCGLLYALGGSGGVSTQEAISKLKGFCDDGFLQQSDLATFVNEGDGNFPGTCNPVDEFDSSACGELNQFLD